MPRQSARHSHRSAEDLSRPRSTYRLQFNREFGFAQATALLPYLQALGISHVYASPYFKSRPGSAHGYDITDYNSLNPEIGTATDYERFCEALTEAGMGQVLDVVPNHMAVGHTDNAWWLDVLEWGRESPYAGFFDINWTPRQPTLRGKVLLPLLGDQYGRVLERGELTLHFDDQAGNFCIGYFEHRFPIDPRHYGAILTNTLKSAHGAMLDSDATMAIVQLAEAFPPGTDKKADKSALLDARSVADRVKKALGDLSGANPAVAALLHRAAENFNGRRGEPESFTPLHDLLEQQHYRLAFWRVAADEINYRCFFDISDLAGIRTEKPEVFEQTHRLIGRLIAEGKIQGLRLDHVDGLLDPAAYFAQLRRLVSGCRPNAAEADGSQPGGPPFYILAEKILAGDEQLRSEWPIAGTTGYEFINLVNGIFIDPDGERVLDRTYRRFLGRSTDFDEMLYACKTQVIDTILASQFNDLVGQLSELSKRHWSTRDYTEEQLRGALREVVAGFSVYRTYVSERGIAAEDRRDIDRAVSQARKTYRRPDPEILNFVHQALTTDLADRAPVYGRAETLRFALRVQQYTGPVMAKSLEDTCFYRYNRLLSLNEVGGDPRQFGTSPAAFHRFMQARAQRWPDALSPSATHDTKRGADVRARLNVLSEVPAAWDERVRRWASLNRPKRQRVGSAPVPSPNDEYMIYQAMLGVWSAELAGAASFDAAVADLLRERLQAAVLKAIREAKQCTSWINPQADYENACLAFVGRILERSRQNAFLEDFVEFQAKIARLGVLNGLCQSVITLTAPGVPDIYQGGELWDLNLVDPDNRRPVEFEQRRRALSEIRQILVRPATERSAALHTLLEHWQDGRIKLAMIAALLDCRRRERSLFTEGDYRQLAFDGLWARHLIGYYRHRNGRICLVIAGRLFASLIGDRPDVYPGGSLWSDTALILPGGSSRFENALTGATLSARDDRLSVSEVLSDLPAAVLMGSAED